MQQSNFERDKLQMEAVTEGSIAAFEELYDRYAPMVCRIALQMIHCTADAEDICQEVFLELWRRPESYDASKGSLQAWLYLKTRSRSLDLLRRRKRHTTWNTEAIDQRSPVLQNLREHPVPQISLPTDPTAESVLCAAEQSALRQALSQLPEPQRLALEASYWEGRTHQEIAADIQKPLGTVKSLIRYGRRKLQHLMQKEGWGAVRGGMPHE